MTYNIDSDDKVWDTDLVPLSLVVVVGVVVMVSGGERLQ